MHGESALKVGSEGGSKQRVRYFDADGQFINERDYFGGFEYERKADQSNPAITQFPFREEEWRQWVQILPMNAR